MSTIKLKNLLKSSFVKHQEKKINREKIEESFFSSVGSMIKKAAEFGEIINSISTLSRKGSELLDPSKLNNLSSEQKNAVKELHEEISTQLVKQLSEIIKTVFQKGRSVKLDNVTIIKIFVAALGSSIFSVFRGQFSASPVNIEKPPVIKQPPVLSEPKPIQQRTTVQ